MEDQDTKINTVGLARAVEALLEIIFKLAGIALTYFILNGIGLVLFSENGFSSILESYGLILLKSESQNQDLFNLLIFPLIYVLKDSYIVFEPFAIKSYMSKVDITVESGILTRKIDKLRLDNLENIEIVKSPIGRWNYRWKSYGTLNLYAFGGVVVIPFVENPEDRLKEIEINLETLKCL